MIEINTSPSPNWMVSRFLYLFPHITITQWWRKGKDSIRINGILKTGEDKHYIDLIFTAKKYPRSSHPEFSIQDASLVPIRKGDQ